MSRDFGRRGLLAGLGSLALGAGPPLPFARAAGRPAHEAFSFLFITDTHIQPELNAAAGCLQCFAHARTVPADFVIQGGDHVFDALGVGRARADRLVELYARTESALGRVVHHAIGNHDVCGVYPTSGVPPTDPLYGKKFYADHFGPLYYGFDHRGVHFFVLDSIGITEDHDYEGRVDAAQLAWLQSSLQALAPGTPIIVVSHIPLVTAFAAYLPESAKLPRHHKFSVANGPEVTALLAGHNVLGVLQGHSHINETVWWRGIPYITCGAVCGNWWHGTHLGTPEGFSVVRVADHRLDVRYERYGFHSVDPHDT